jgi:hypothetical protein
MFDHLQAYNILTKYVCLPSYFSPFNSENLNVSNYILLHNYMVFIKNIFSCVILSMKTFGDVVISIDTRIWLNTKTWHIYDYMTRKWSLVIFVLVINVKLWCSDIHD